MTKSSTTLKFATALMLSAGMSSMAFAGNYPTYEPDLLPSGAQAGQCYARVMIPAQYSTSQETVMVEEGYNKVQVHQPKLASRTEQVEIKQASVRYEVRQPTFRTVSEQKLVRPSYEKLSVSPPQFKTITETVQVSSPRTVWKRGNPGALRAQGYTIISVADAGIGGRGYRGTTDYGATGGTSCGSMCEIWCLVEVPGESMSFNRRVMINPGQVRRTGVPAKYTTINRQIVADPGGVREIPVPAQYRSITVEDVIEPGGEHVTNVPPKYGQVNKRTLISGERYEWRRVVCNPRKTYRPPSHGGGSKHHGGSVHGSKHGSSGHSGGAAQHNNRGSSYHSRSQPIIYGGTGSTTKPTHTTGERGFYYGTDKRVHRQHGN